MNRRRGMWLALAVVLLAAGAWLMVSGSGEQPAPEPKKIVFPSRMQRSQWKRADERKTQVVPAVLDAGVVAGEKPRMRDPVLAALPRGAGHSAMVIEANALRNSPIGELLLDCLLRDGGRSMEDFRKATGVDPLQDLDRLVITDEGMVFSGDFSKAHFQDMLQERVALDYGPGARVYEPGAVLMTGGDGGVRRGRNSSAVGTWNNQMLVVGDSPDAVKKVLDRVQGGGSNEQPVIPEDATYGEMYGVVSVEMLARMLPPDQAELAQRLKEAASTVELHMDASSDMAMVAHVKGSDDSKVQDLGKSLGAALSVARLKAQADGNTDMAQMLDFAKVQPDGSSFKMELAVPLDVLRERLAFCRDERQASEAREAAPGMEGNP
ncbi:hypothetical protein [Hyalangium versicolor]|uniref:hypothetical protein n=1 Tax=Hyalangium versicolor TaxID=2861190 RepID=UPI001CCB5EC3|nr:hypothetical protein [Hyalangium versicolor]